MKREDVTCNDCKTVNRCWDEPIPHPLNCSTFDNPELLKAIEQREYDYKLMKQVTEEVLEFVRVAANLTSFYSVKDREEFCKFLDDIPNIMNHMYE